MPCRHRTQQKAQATARSAISGLLAVTTCGFTCTTTTLGMNSMSTKVGCPRVSSKVFKCYPHLCPLLAVKWRYSCAPPGVCRGVWHPRFHDCRRRFSVRACFVDLSPGRGNLIHVCQGERRLGDSTCAINLTNPGATSTHMVQRAHGDHAASASPMQSIDDVLSNKLARCNQLAKVQKSGQAAYAAPVGSNRRLPSLTLGLHRLYAMA